MGDLPKSPVHTREHLGRVPARQGPWIFIYRKKRDQLALPEIKWSTAVGERAQARDPTTLLWSALTNSVSAERERKPLAPRVPSPLWQSTRCFRARAPWRSGPQCPSQSSGLPVAPRSRVPATEGWAEPGTPPTWPRPVRPGAARARPELLARSSASSLPCLRVAASSSLLRVQLH